MIYEHSKKLYNQEAYGNGLTSDKESLNLKTHILLYNNLDRRLCNRPLTCDHLWNLLVTLSFHQALSALDLTR
jgi:hypothetical protein